ncbi:hypothetical protein KK083_07245 [Fulvivirgaceae bacterium PWU4]|uniref:Uncharacterized protein n=1 Tax=Chryseosolibacter histidini TaxID=2782349 RepID=A0AAP2DK46_9BACT|nr:hypothetical protein [Chryseosolibacter histidini]
MLYITDRKKNKQCFCEWCKPVRHSGTITNKDQNPSNENAVLQHADPVLHSSLCNRQPCPKLCVPAPKLAWPGQESG